MFAKYGRNSGFSQTAPGRDLPNLDQKRKELQPGQADIASAIGGPAQLTPAPDTQVFSGAKQTTQPAFSPSENNTGINGGRDTSQVPSPTAGLGDQLRATSIYDTSQQTPEQRAAMARDTSARHTRDAAGAQADQDYLAANGGNWGTRQQYRPEGADPSAGDYGGVLAGGSAFTTQSTPGQTPASTPAVGPAAGTYHTNLMEGDPDKLADHSHAATSPKYDFLQLAQQNKYDYTQMPEMLKELQSGANGKFWQGWAADGKGNFVFHGDPSQLDPSWKGVTRVDAVGSFGNLSQGKSAAGWRWGADDPNAPAGSSSSFSPGMLQTAITGGPATLPNDPNASDYSARLRESIMKALQVNPTLAAAGKQFGY